MIAQIIKTDSRDFKNFIILSIIVLTVTGFITNLYAQENKPIILATTTSVQDSGLLEVLIDAFQKKTGYIVKAVAVGSGQAFKWGKMGEVDILWVHSPDDEKEFMEGGYGIKRITFMHNDYIVLGPQDDAAKIAEAKNVIEAFKKIVDSNALFISRADNSATHKKERLLWDKAGVFPKKEDYLEVGEGMGQTIVVANEKQGYVLSDRSTYLTLKKSINLTVVFEGDSLLINPYSLILINPKRFPKTNIGGAEALYNFLLSGESKEIIENFGKEKFGQPLFFWDYKAS